MRPLEPFAAGNPPFLVSSALPYAGDVLLFPRPLIPFGSTKALKKVAFVSEGALLLLAQGDVPDSAARRRQELIQGGAVWITPEERKHVRQLLLEGEENARERARMAARFEQDAGFMRLWWGHDEPPAPRVALDRLSSASSLFFTGRLSFAPGCGLYFWASFRDTTARTDLERALVFLEDEGIGGKRSTGGQFDFERLDRELPRMEDPNRLLTLSLYRPSSQEVGARILRDAWFRRIFRQGWIYSPEGRNLRRKGLWMLREGSVLRSPPTDGPPPLGTFEDVRPAAGFPHPVWRCGYAFILPMRLEEAS